MPWLTCHNCGHERAYTGSKPVGSRTECPMGCGATVEIDELEI